VEGPGTLAGPPVSRKTVIIVGRQSAGSPIGARNQGSGGTVEQSRYFQAFRSPSA
jgi:hypothetical protein